MAGTNHSATPPREAAPTPPVVILVGPQLGLNIGATARAMLNCGLRRLRLVRPRDGWPNPEATAMAAGADAVLDGAEVFDTTAEATADLSRVYATTARKRDLRKPVVTPQQAAAEIHALSRSGATSGLLFGPERTGLETDDVVASDSILHIPLNPAFSSLNLAQAVLLTGWAWYAHGPASAVEPRTLHDTGENPAPHGAVAALVAHLEQALDAAGFVKAPTKRPALLRTLRNAIVRADLAESEISLLHGVVTALSGRRADGRPRGAPRKAEPTDEAS